MERCQERPTFLSDFRWAKCLLTRADFPLWSKDVEFVASVYNVFLRRSQIRAVQLSWRKNPLTEADAISLQDVTAVDLMSEALASGDVNSVKQVLRKKNLHLKLRKAFQRLQMCQRMVRGSEASRDDLIPKFMAMRVWNGCSSLFFTLNPHDIRSPISLMLLQGSEVFQREFSFGGRCALQVTPVLRLSAVRVESSPWGRMKQVHADSAHAASSHLPAQSLCLTIERLSG